MSEETQKQPDNDSKLTKLLIVLAILEIIEKLFDIITRLIG
nr:MAG TPA: hypothetical protein [Caudoviricetes sp.]